MKKLNKKEIEDAEKKLKPYWDKYWEIYKEFRDKEEKLQKEMNKKVGFNINLEFFYVDGFCVGIGAESWSDRKKFPLIQNMG